LMQFKNRTYILPSLFSSNASSKGVRRTPFLPFSNNLDSKRKCPCVIFPFIFGSTTTIPIWLISLPQYHSITLLYHFLPLNNIISPLLQLYINFFKLIVSTIYIFIS